MAGASNAYENLILDHVTGKTSLTAGTHATYMGLTTATIGDTDTLSTITEAAYTGYARVAVSGATWNAASGGSATNASAIQFGDCSGGTSTVVGWFLTGAASGTAGTISLYGAVTSTVISTTQTPPKFSAGAITLSAD